MGRSKKVTPKRLAGKLEASREAPGLTYEELISKLDCPEIPLYRVSISRYESGKIDLPIPILLRYARPAKIFTDVFIDDESELDESIVHPQTSQPK